MSKAIANWTVVQKDGHTGIHRRVYPKGKEMIETLWITVKKHKSQCGDAMFLAADTMAAYLNGNHDIVEVRHAPA